MEDFFSRLWSNPMTRSWLIFFGVAVGTICLMGACAVGLVGGGFAWVVSLLGR